MLSKKAPWLALCRSHFLYVRSIKSIKWTAAFICVCCQIPVITVQEETDAASARPLDLHEEQEEVIEASAQPDLTSSCHSVNLCPVTVAWSQKRRPKNTKHHRRTFAFPVVCSFMIIAKSFHKWLIPIRPRESRPGDQQTTLPDRKHLRSLDGCCLYSNLKLRRLRLCEPFCQPPKENCFVPISAGRYWLSFFYFGQKQEVIEI